MALRIAKGFGIAVAALIALVALILLGLNTAPGKRFIADRLGGIETASGITVKIGRIEGSIYGRMVLRGLEVRDQQGAFLTSPELVVDWRPFAYLPFQDRRARAHRGACRVPAQSIAEAHAVRSQRAAAARYRSERRHPSH